VAKGHLKMVDLLNVQNKQVISFC
jgi:hypothetical protein